MHGVRNGAGLKKAYEWVMEGNRTGRFRGMVYGPVLLEVQCQDRQHITYLEQNCPSNTRTDMLGCHYHVVLTATQADSASIDVRRSLRVLCHQIGFTQAPLTIIAPV